MKTEFPPHVLVFFRENVEANLEALQSIQDKGIIGWGPQEDGVYRFAIKRDEMTKKDVQEIRQALPYAEVSSIYRPPEQDKSGRELLRYVVVDLHRFGPLKHGFFAGGEWREDPNEADLYMKDSAVCVAQSYGEKQQVQYPHLMEVKVWA